MTNMNIPIPFFVGIFAGVLLSERLFAALTGVSYMTPVASTTRTSFQIRQKMQKQLKKGLLFSTSGALYALMVPMKKDENSNHLSWSEIRCIPCGAGRVVSIRSAIPIFSLYYAGMCLYKRRFHWYDIPMFTICGVVDYSIWFCFGFHCLNAKEGKSHSVRDVRRTTSWAILVLIACNAFALSKMHSHYKKHQKPTNISRANTEPPTYQDGTPFVNNCAIPMAEAPK
jgi:hypothetical protein